MGSGWLTKTHPDPHGLTLRAVRADLAQNPSATAGCALFWDMACRPQIECTEAEEQVGRRALAVMTYLYSSITGTAVLQQKEVPPRPAEFDGWVMLFNVPKVLWATATRASRPLWHGAQLRATARRG